MIICYFYEYGQTACRHHHVNEACNYLEYDWESCERRHSNNADILKLIQGANMVSIFPSLMKRCPLTRLESDLSQLKTITEN